MSLHKHLFWQFLQEFFEEIKSFLFKVTLAAILNRVLLLPDCIDQQCTKPNKLSLIDKLTHYSMNATFKFLIVKYQYSPCCKKY